MTNRRPRVAALAGLIMLAGCSSQTSVWGQYFTILKEGYRNVTGPGAVTLEQATAIPYASLAYRVGNDRERMLVLATDTNGELLWTAASRVVLVTRDGRIVRSVGLKQNKGGMTATSGTPSVAAALKAPFASSWVADFPDAGFFGVRVDCRASARGRQIIKILGTAMNTVRVDENCRSRNPNWSYTDSFWIDSGSGFVWRSVQHLHPKGATLQLSILRPPE